MGNKLTEGLARADLKSFRTRWLLGLGTMLGVLAVLWIAHSIVREDDQHETIAAKRIEAIARSISIWVDGDQLNELVNDYPEKAIVTWDQAPAALVSMGDSLHQAAQANQLPAPIRTLRIRNAFQSAIANRPDQVHPGALEVVLCGGEDPQWRKAVDYVPAMGDAFLNSKSTTTLQGSNHMRAFAPVRDSWGKTIGIAEVTERSNPPLLGLTLKLVLWTLSAFAALFGLTKLIDAFLRRHCAALEHLALETRRLRAGERVEPVWVPSSVREVRRIAEALEEWRVSQDPARRWAPPTAKKPRQPSPAQTAALKRAVTPRQQAPLGQQAKQRGPAAPIPLEKKPKRRTRVLSEPVRFDLGLLIQQAQDGACQRCKVKHLDLRVLMAERLPAELVGDPSLLLEAIGALLENAIKYTKTGCVTLRVGRAADGQALRFEVADTGIGVAWHSQPMLDKEITKAHELDLRDAKGGLFKAAAIAANFGGQLGFESQPGSGSRFWFTANFQAGSAAEARLPRPLIHR